MEKDNRNFLDEVLYNHEKDQSGTSQSKPNKTVNIFDDSNVLPSRDDMIYSSFILSTTLMNVLLQRNIVDRVELNSIMAEVRAMLEGGH